MNEDEDIEAFFEDLLSSVDLYTEMKKIAFSGFDTFEEYELYGDLFIPHEINYD